MAKITVKDTEVNVIKVNGEDYICLTDMLRAKTVISLLQTGYVTETRLNLSEFGRRCTILILIMANSP